MRAPMCYLGSAGVVALVTGVAGLNPNHSNPPAQLALQELQADFHGSFVVADYDLLHSLWAEDAVAFIAGFEVHGPDEISDLIALSPYWGVSASLAPSYKTNWNVNGNTASIQFECVIVYTGELDPLTTPLSMIPFGGQNPDVEIVQHLSATATAVKENGRWVFQEFIGGAGPF